MGKKDFKKELKEFYNPTTKEVTLTDVPEMNFLTIEGQGAPESEQFAKSIQALYPIAYTIKFDIKKNEGIDFGVMPLEGLWWADDMNDFDTKKGNRNNWKWQLIIMQPKIVTKGHFNIAVEAVKKKKNNPLFDKVKFESFKEGKAVQIMHIGPFSEEGPNIIRLHDKITEIGAELSGKHHEIYLSDFRRVNPAKMKTVLRQPYNC